MFGDGALANQVVTELSTNPLKTFVTLMDQAMQNETETDHKGKKKDDGNGVVLDDGQCRR